MQDKDASRVDAPGSPPRLVDNHTAVSSLCETQLSSVQLLPLRAPNAGIWMLKPQPL